MQPHHWARFDRDSTAASMSNASVLVHPESAQTMPFVHEAELGQLISFSMAPRSREGSIIEVVIDVVPLLNFDHEFALLLSEDAVSAYRICHSRRIRPWRKSSE